MRTGNPEVSKERMTRTPERPCWKPSQTDLVSFPRAQSAPIPLMTTRREDEAMMPPYGKDSDGARSGCRRPAAAGVAVLALGQHRQAQQVLQLSAEDEVVLAEERLRPRLVEVGEEDLGLGDQF